MKKMVNLKKSICGLSLAVAMMVPFVPNIVGDSTVRAETATGKASIEEIFKPTSTYNNRDVAIAYKSLPTWSNFTGTGIEFVDGNVKVDGDQFQSLETDYYMSQNTGKYYQSSTVGNNYKLGLQFQGSIDVTNNTANFTAQEAGTTKGQYTTLVELAFPGVNESQKLADGTTPYISQGGEYIVRLEDASGARIDVRIADYAGWEWVSFSAECRNNAEEETTHYSMYGGSTLNVYGTDDVAGNNNGAEPVRTKWKNILSPNALSTLEIVYDYEDNALYAVVGDTRDASLPPFYCLIRDLDNTTNGANKFEGFSDPTNLKLSVYKTKASTRAAGKTSFYVLNIDGKAVSSAEFLNEYIGSFANLQQVDGAQVRKSGVTGLRFQSALSKEFVDSFIEKGYTVEFGTLYAPTDFLTGKKFVLTDVEERKVKKIEATNYQEIDGQYVFYTTMINIQTANIDRAFSARTYLIISKDGEVKYVLYTDYNEQNNSRSAYQVASGLLAKENNGLDSTEEKFLIDNYISIVG